MGKKKNDERPQMKTLGPGKLSDRAEEKDREEHLAMKTQGSAKSTKSKEKEKGNKLTSVQNLGETKKPATTKEVYREYTYTEDDDGSDENIPDSWEEMDASNHPTKSIGTEQQSWKIPSEEHVNKWNKDSGDRFPTQQRLRKGLEDKEEVIKDPETITGEHTNWKTHRERCRESTDLS
ncbi:hypothetical protein HPB52_022313 [Rhipicephalus sanguineus]|uniref:Uncharacterized protein n=1 Tax=Rhipicephalus sanguineus TaxID=34632 RepID=A0A9D4T0B6_RHISA|nr:hypothetical protein HPB52_022313 [Rhipicephalus sanguineus]